MSDKAGKGGGARKYGSNTKQPSKAGYKARSAAGNTPKMRRVTKALKRGQNQPGYFLTESGKAMKK